MEEAFIQNAVAYAAQCNLQLAERLGFGIHGIIYVAEDKSASGRTAVKAHREPEPYFREVSAYERLREENISEILGFNIPQIIRADNSLFVIEMTIVARPFVLDFAGAFLGAPPDFSDEIWADWEAEKQEQFGPRWPTVQTIMASLRFIDIYMVDVSPSNIAFLD